MLNKLKEKAKKLSDSTSSLTESAYKSVSEGVEDGINATKNVTDKAQNGITEAYNSVNETIDDGIKATKETINDTQYAIETSVDSITDTIEDTVEATKDLAQSTVKVAKYSAITLAGAGIIIATITAPVSIPIGLLIMDILLSSPTGSGSSPDSQGPLSKKTDYKSERKRKQAIKALIKYGKIPSNAVVETDFVRLVIDTEEGTTNGEILQGRFGACELKMLTNEELNSLIENAPDKDSKDILKSYKEYKDQKVWSG